MTSFDDGGAPRLRGPPPRSIAERYVDALGGSWAGTGLMVLGVTATAVTLGLAIGCPLGGGLGCAVASLYGAMGGGALGWFLGPGIGTARGAGLSPGEAFGPWALGVVTYGAMIGIGAGLGAAIDAGRGAGASGLGWGLGAATILGGLVQVFVTPLYAVLLYEDRPEDPADIQPAIHAYAAPIDGGLLAGCAGAF